MTANQLRSSPPPWPGDACEGEGATPDGSSDGNWADQWLADPVIHMLNEAVAKPLPEQAVDVRLALLCGAGNARPCMWSCRRPARRWCSSHWPRTSADPMQMTCLGTVAADAPACQASACTCTHAPSRLLAHSWLGASHAHVQDDLFQRMEAMFTEPEHPPPAELSRPDHLLGLVCCPPPAKLPGAVAPASRLPACSLAPTARSMLSLVRPGRLHASRYLHALRA